MRTWARGTRGLSRGTWVRWIGAGGLAALTALITSAAARRTARFDLLIRHARIVDGTGNPWFRGDVGVSGDRIAAIGSFDPADATRVIDAADRVVAPGFIDMMAETAVPLIVDSISAESKLRQGVTTIFVGEGDSDAPTGGSVPPDTAIAGGERVTWQTFGDYARILERKGIGVNVAYNVGAAQIRRVVLGDQDVRPSPAQLTEMQGLVTAAMREGATGVSSALIYAPGTYATTDELTALARAAAPYHGVYFTHMRNESNQVLDAIRETIRIGVSAGVPVHIYHIKAAGQENWSLMPRALALIDSARAAGVEVTADFYPYIRNGIGLRAFLDPRHYIHGSDSFLRTVSDSAVRRQLRHEVETATDWENWYRHVGMNWDNVLITGVPRGIDTTFVGLSVAGVAKRRRVDPWAAFFDLVGQTQGDVDVAPQSMDEEQKRLALRATYVAIDNDQRPVDPAAVQSAHPRAFGTFPRILAKYVREQHVISLEEAVRKMSSLPANILGLHERGRIAPGMIADLVLFDPARVQDHATFTKPLVYSTGIDVVIINGHLVLDSGPVIDYHAGRVLRH